MKALITDLTRMYDYHACAAGIDIDTGKRVRPVQLGRLSSRLLASRGGPLDIGNVVDFGRCRPSGKRPEIEDVLFDLRAVKLLKVLAPIDFMATVRRSAEDALDVIGPALVRHGNALATDSGQGSRSLVIVRAPEPPTIAITNGRLRFKWLDGVWLSVTDVRLYQHDLATPDEGKLEGLRRALKSHEDVYLSFGLGRPWQQPGDDRERHYLQLNNVHVLDWFGWRLTVER